MATYRHAVSFDIDGTLISPCLVHHDAYEHAFLHIYGVRADIKGAHTAGSTDKAVIREVMTGKGLSITDIDEGLDDCMTAMVEYYAAAERQYDLLPGVPELLDRLADRGVLIGVVSGNLEGIANLKMASIWRGIPAFGGYGSEADERLVLMQRSYGRVCSMGLDSAGSYWHIGDTPKDIIVPNQLGLRSIGVATGNYGRKKLRAYQPTYSLDNLGDVELVVELITGR